jgi:predicted dehydrogenase
MKHTVRRSQGSDFLFNLAVVGLGRWGQRLVDSVQDPGSTPSSKAQFTRGVVRNLQHAEAYGRSRGLALCTDYQAVLHDPAVHGVVLATPHLQHEAQILAAAEAGKHVFVEKPLALAMGSALRICNACRERNITLALGHNRRFLPSINHLRKLLTEGQLGQFLHVEGNMSGNFALSYKATNWRASPEESPLGAMTAMGIHMIDAFLYIVGPMSAVSALSLRTAVSIGIDDTTSLLLRFLHGGSGYIGTIYATAPTFRVQLFGTAGSAHLIDRDTVVVTDVNGRPQQVTFDHCDIERAELESFSDAAQGSGHFPISPEDGVHGIAVMEAAIRSAAASRFEPVLVTL